MSFQMVQQMGCPLLNRRIGSLFEVLSDITLGPTTEGKLRNVKMNVILGQSEQWIFCVS